MTKNIISIALTLLLVAAVQAQNKMVLNLDGGTPQEFAVSEIDSMTWDNPTTVRIYRQGQTPLTIANVKDISWDVTSEQAPAITKGDIQLGVGETFLINDSLTEVHAADCSVKFSPTVTEESKQLIVRTATAVPPVTIEDPVTGELINISEAARAVDLDLEGMHILDGDVEIRIPISRMEGYVPAAAWYNEETANWEPVDFEYDKQTSEVVIHSVHLSTFEAFQVKDEHTRKARLRFYTVPFVEEEFKLTDAMLDLIKNYALLNLKIYDKLDEYWGVFSQYGLDMGYNAIKAGGWQNAFLEKYSDELGYLGTLFTVYEVFRAGLSGDNETAGINSMKAVLNLATSTAADALSSSLMSAGMFCVAIIDYSRSAVYDYVITTRHDTFERCYNRYYVNYKDSLKHHARSAKQWFNILWPIYEAGSVSPEGVKERVEEIIDEYCWEYWNLPDADRIDIWLYEGGPQNQFEGGINEKLRQELVNSHKAMLHRDILPPVFQSISYRLKDKQYTLLRKGLEDYAKSMNQAVRLDLSGQPATDGASWKGCKVRFKELPATITDPEKWESNINEEGKGTIRFTLYSYMAEDVQPTLELVKNGKVLREMPICINIGANTINIGQAPKPLLMVTPTEMTFSSGAGMQQATMDTDADNIDITPSDKWITTTYDAATKKLKVEVENNAATEAREGTISITVTKASEEETKTITVKQEGYKENDSQYDAVYFDFRMKNVPSDLEFFSSVFRFWCPYTYSDTNITTSVSETMWSTATSTTNGTICNIVAQGETALYPYKTTEYQGETWTMNINIDQNAKTASGTIIQKVTINMYAQDPLKYNVGAIKKITYDIAITLQDLPFRDRVSIGDYDYWTNPEGKNRVAEYYVIDSSDQDAMSHISGTVTHKEYVYPSEKVSVLDLKQAGVDFIRLYVFPTIP
jgi:hypothetical protein